MARDLAVVLLGCVVVTQTLAARLEVGPSYPLKQPSAAASIAKDGDVIVIDAGTYFDCAVWTANHLTISGAGNETILTDKTCEGKALFVIKGDDVTVRNLTFARARVADGNGAGIRIEGGNPTVLDAKFTNNQSGILAGDNPDSTIVITNSEFVDNGSCQQGCISALLVGHVSLLRVSGSRFSQTKLAHHISSAATKNEVIDNTIEDGTEGTSSYLLDLPDGGTLLLDHNQLEKGPRSSNQRAAIVIGDGAGARTAGEVIASGNRFVNDTGGTVAFILNWSDATPSLYNNEFVGDVTPVSTSGAWVHTVRVAINQTKAVLRPIAVTVYRLISDEWAQFRGRN